MRILIGTAALVFAAASLAACHRSTPPDAVNVSADNTAEANAIDANAIESASGPDDKAALPADTNLSTDNATAHGNTDHGNTDHGNTDHGNTDH